MKDGLSEQISSSPRAMHRRRSRSRSNSDSDEQERCRSIEMVHSDELENALNYSDEESSHRVEAKPRMRGKKADARVFK